MSGIKQRTAEFLRAERAVLMEQVDEVDLLLSLLDDEPPVVEPAAEPVEQEPEVVKPEPAKPQGYPGMTKAQVAARVAHDRRTIIRLLGANGRPVTIREVAERLGVQDSTAGSKLMELLAEGRVVRHRESMNGRHLKGRARWLYELAPVVEEREHHLDEKTNVVED